MIRLLVVNFAMACQFANAAIADDYIVRVDTIGYIDRPATEEKLTETVLQSIEVVTDANLRFHGKVTLGARTLQLRGKLTLSDTGDVFVQIRYADCVELSETVLTETGKSEPLLDESKIQSGISIPLGKPTTIGGFENTKTQTQNAATKSTKSKLNYVLIVKKNEMPAD